MLPHVDMSVTTHAHRGGLVVVLSCCVASVIGHGAMTFPTPRNAIDGVLPEFKAWRYPCDATHQGVNCTITFCGDMQNCEC